MSKFTHWKKLHNPDYIGAYAFDPGQEIVATIKSVAEELVMGPDSKKEKCCVARFVEADIKPLICNVTNSKAITLVAGSPYIEKWPGVRIQLYVAQVKAFGDVVDAVRVRTRPPKPTKKDSLTPTHSRWAGAAQSLASGETTIEQIQKHFELSDEDKSKLVDEAEGIREAADA